MKKILLIFIIVFFAASLLYPQTEKSVKQSLELDKTIRIQDTREAVSSEYRLCACRNRCRPIVKNLTTTWITQKKYKVNNRAN
jgi:hypothetical protein